MAQTSSSFKALSVVSRDSLALVVMVPLSCDRLDSTLQPRGKSVLYLVSWISWGFSRAGFVAVSLRS